MIDQAIGELVPLVGVRAACQAVGRPRGSHYRRHRSSPPLPKPERVASPQPRALSQVERKEVLRALHDPEHVDEAPSCWMRASTWRRPPPCTACCEPRAR
jgi:hypothetical protein